MRRLRRNSRVSHAFSAEMVINGIMTNAIMTNAINIYWWSTRSASSGGIRSPNACINSLDRRYIGPGQWFYYETAFIKHYGTPRFLVDSS